LLRLVPPRSNQGRNEGEKGHNSPGAESLRRAPKSPDSVTSTFFNSTFASVRPQVRTRGAKLASCPGRNL